MQMLRIRIVLFDNFCSFDINGSPVRHSFGFWGLYLSKDLPGPDKHACVCFINHQSNRRFFGVQMARAVLHPLQMPRLPPFVEEDVLAVAELPHGAVAVLDERQTTVNV